MSEGAAPQTGSIIPVPGSLTKSSPERTSRWPAPHRWIWEVTGTWVNGLLLAVCLLAGLFGWWLGPVVDGAPALPQLPMIVVDFSPPLVGVHINQTLQNLPGESLYTLTAFGGTVPKDVIYYNKRQGVLWNVALSGIGTGRILVSPTRAVRCSSSLCIPNSWFIGGKSQWNQPVGLGSIAGRLATDCLHTLPECLVPEIAVAWRDDPPVATNGQYLSAAFPSIYGGGGSIGSVASELFVPGLLNYTVQSGSPPSSQSSVWDWRSTASTSTVPTISFVAADLVGLQRANRNAFYAGILLGIAAAGAVALLTNVLGAIDKKRRRQALKVAEAPTTLS